MPSTSTTKTILCSWLPPDTVTAPSFYKEIQVMEEQALGLQQAEVNMTLAAEHLYDANTGTALDDTETAPTIKLEIASATAAICITSNAKTVEIHRLGESGETLLGTFEANAEVNGWYQHFLLGGQNGEVLLPPSVPVMLKFFARRPKNYINISTLCIIHGETPKSPLLDMDVAFKSQSTTEQLKKLYDAVNNLQNQLGRNMEMVARRMEMMEDRLQRMENRINSA